MIKQEYIIIKSNSIDSLMDRVNVRLENGWSVSGGVSIDPSTIGVRVSYLQALVKLSSSPK